MSRSYWRAIAVFFALANIGGGILAVVMGEMNHALGHAALAAVCLVWCQQLFVRRKGEPAGLVLPATETRLDQLQQSMDAIAVEIERLGEAQRFQEKLYRRERQRDQRDPLPETRPEYRPAVTPH